MKFEIFSPTPVIEIIYIADLIKDKIVCDVGSGDGVWAGEMREFAKEVKEIEIDSNFTDTPQDFVEVDLSIFEVLFINMGEIGAKELGKKLLRDGWHGIVISYSNTLFENIKYNEKRMTFLIYKI